MRRRHRPPVERLSGLESERDMREAVDVAVAAFPKHSRAELTHTFRDVIWKGTIFDPENTRIVVADGRVVSVVIMNPKTIRFGPSTVPAMNVGYVATHPDYQRLGYSAACLNDCTRYMKENGYLAAYMAGFRKFYHRFGYYPFEATGGVTVFAGESQRQGLPGRMRTITRKDIPRVARLYEKATRTLMFAGARDRNVWQWLIRYGIHDRWFENPRLILDARGRPVGYVTIQGKKGLLIREVVALQDERSWRTVLGVLGRFARRRGLEKYALPLHWGHPMSVYLRQYFQTWNVMNTKPDGGGLMAIIDFPGFMRALEGLLTERRRAAGSGIRNVRFTLGSEIGSVGVTVSPRRVTTGGPGAGKCRNARPDPRFRVFVGTRWLSGLSTGYYAARDIADREGVRMPPSVRPVMDVLFPREWPMMLWADRA